MNETYECLTCGSKEVDHRMTRYFGIPGMVIVPNSYLLCEAHKDLRYKFEDVYDEKGKRKEIDHDAVKLRSVYETPQKSNVLKFKSILPEYSNRWIDVHIKLPKDKQRCLIWDKNCHVSYDSSPETISHIYVARFYQGEHRTNHWRSCDTGFGNNQYPWNWEEGARQWFSQDVTHWMPLPEPLK